MLSLFRLATPVTHDAVRAFAGSYTHHHLHLHPASTAQMACTGSRHLSSRDCCRRFLTCAFLPICCSSRRFISSLVCRCRVHKLAASLGRHSCSLRTLTTTTLSFIPHALLIHRTRIRPPQTGFSSWRRPISCRRRESLTPVLGAYSRTAPSFLLTPSTTAVHRQLAPV